ncbi:polysaccharide biosynthesis tyrosine autokinase [Petrotoga sp. 9PWA.NaAc.5.4]|uniref:GumC family protein n=1 Tax=Petrotoga sp. 9PWA.NaAc.5.4 TaxID=1434328 RepID=UPI000CB6125D|nr:polysaccharide biosynthesis tyrosine autokinase [Petrotoga sp. 9PWA.NaAc.5.4]PNR96991.1 sugar tyrosine-protein kinase [Petrotoga sp. 9PWA.NaAc.5.4]
MEEEKQENELTFEDILKIFKNRFWWFFLTVIVTVCITLIYLFTATPIYEATATLKVDSSKQGSVADIFGSQMTTGSSKISTEIELIKSRRNLEKVIENLNLVDYFRANSENPEGVTINDIIKTLNDMITVSPIGDTNIVKISVQSEDPDLARRVADELSLVYNDLLKSLSQNEYTARRVFIQEQIPKVEEELQNAQDNLRKFKEENNVFILDEEAKAILQFLVSYDQQLNAYQVQLNGSKAKIDALNDVLKSMDQEIISSETISINPVVSNLRNQIVNIQVQLAGIEGTKSPNDPEVLKLKEQLAQAQEMLKNEIATIVTSQVKTANPQYNSLYAQLIEEQTRQQVTQSTIQSITAIRDTYQTQLNKLPALEQKLMDYQREVQVKENLYVLLLEKLEEARIAEAGVIGTANIIDSAYISPNPVKPNKTLTAAIGGVLGIFLGILVVFLMEYMDKRLKEESDVKRILKNAPILGRIPHVNYNYDEEESKRELIVLNDPVSPISEAYKLLTTNIDFSSSKEPNVICFSSPGPSEGKTTTAANVAISYAQIGKKTLLMDADMRRPRIEKIFELKSRNVGLVNHLLRGVPLERAIQSPIEGLDTLDILPVGVIPPNPTAVLTSNEFKIMLEKLKEQYEKIIIDLPPVLVSSDSVIASRYSDGIVLITRINGTIKTGLRNAYDNINVSGVKLLGTVINDLNVQSSNYYYYYYYYSEDGEKKKRRKRRTTVND